jgi:hypothetical protein
MKERLLAFLRDWRRVFMQGDGAPAWIVVPAVALAASQLMIQAGTLRLPILGEHRWREADTYAVAYNFVHTSWDIFHPRMDLSRGLSGVTGMEPPVLPFVTALAMRVLGDAPAIGRWIVWLTGMGGLAALLLLVRKARDVGLMVGVLVAFTLSPTALFELRQIQPDGPTTMLAAVAAFFFYRFSRLESRRDYLLGVGFYALSVLMKGPGAALAPAMLGFACADRKVTFRQFIKRGLGIGVAVLLYFPWYSWAHHLTDAYNAGHPNFGIDFTYQSAKDSILDTNLLHNLFWFVYACYVSNWVLFPAFIVGLPAAFQRRTRRVSFAFLLWLLFGSLLLGTWSHHLLSHWYYGSLVLVPVAYFTGFGVSEVFRLFTTPSSRQPLVARWAAIAVLVTLVLQRIMVPVKHTLTETVAATGARPEGSWMSDGHLTVLVTVLGLTMIAAQALTGLWLRVTAFVLLPFAAFWGIGRARSDALSVLRWRSRIGEERMFRSRWTNALRPAVDRYSTRADFFVINVPSEKDVIADDPFFLYLPMRRGWVEDTDILAKKGLSFYQKGGARFFLTFNSKELDEEQGLTKLASSAFYRLYCLDPNGCNPIQ